MHDIQSSLQRIQQQIILAEKLAHKSANAVKLIAISKKQSVEKIQAAIAAGQWAFGENYSQEALPKISALKNKNLEWHFIGSIQANKTRTIAENFAWVQSVENCKIAQRLNAQRPTNLPPLNICIQVNISGEASKSGTGINDVVQLARLINSLPQLKLRGLMAIPARHSLEQTRNDYSCMYALFTQLQQQGFAVDTLSMGMSDDFSLAIAEGSTMVRIGTAIFGAR